MGKTVQRRMVRKRNLEIALSKVEAHPTPKAYLEQYTIPANTAAEILYIAAYVNDDVIGKGVVDLGCGTGRLAIGAALLGAKEVVGVDIDKTAVRLARENAIKLGVKDRIQWLIADIDALHGVFETVLQNPPFGVQKRKADRKFLQKSFEIAHKIYSLHKGESKKELVKRLNDSEPRGVPLQPSAFLKNFIRKHGGKICAVCAMVMTIPYMFKFHRKQKHEFLVNLYVIKKEPNNVIGVVMGAKFHSFDKPMLKSPQGLAGVDRLRLLPLSNQKLLRPSATRSNTSLPNRKLHHLKH